MAEFEVLLRDHHIVLEEKLQAPRLRWAPWPFLRIRHTFAQTAATGGNTKCGVHSPETGTKLNDARVEKRHIFEELEMTTPVFTGPCHYCVSPYKKCKHDRKNPKTNTPYGILAPSYFEKVTPALACYHITRALRV